MKERYVIYMADGRVLIRPTIEEVVNTVDNGAIVYDSTETNVSFRWYSFRRDEYMNAMVGIPHVSMKEARNAVTGLRLH